MNKSLRKLTAASFYSVRKGQTGYTLIEVLIAIGIMGAVAVAFLASMTTSSTSSLTHYEQVTAEGLAKSQMEFIKLQNYRVDGLYEKLPPDQIADGYDATIAVEPLNPRGDSQHNDDGLQKITITVTRDCDGNTIFVLEGYKCFIGQ